MFRPRSYPRTAGIITICALILGAGIGQAAPYLAVPTTGEAGKIEIIDTATNAIVAQIDGLEEAHGLAVTPDGRHLIVASLTERDEDAAVKRPDGVSAEDHAAHHGGEKASPDDAALGTAAVIDLQTGAMIRQLDVPGGVHHVAVSPDGRFAVLTHPGLASVSAIDLETYKVNTSILVGDDPNYAAFTADGTELLVSVAGEDQIVFVNVASWQMTARLSVGAVPEHLALTRDGRLVVNLTGDEAVAIVDLAAKIVSAVHTLGGALHGIDVSDDGTAAIVSLMDLDKIARVRLVDGVTTFRDLAPAPYHVTAMPGSAKTFVSSAAAPGLTVIDERDLLIMDRIATSGIGHQMVPLPDHLLEFGAIQ